MNVGEKLCRYNYILLLISLYQMLYFLIRDKYNYVEATKNISLLLSHMVPFAISEFLKPGIVK